MSNSGTLCAMLVLLLFVITGILASPALPGGQRWRRSILPTDRDNCKDGPNTSPNVVDTTERLKSLRAQFTNAGIQAYIIPMDDEHGSEYVSEHDKRLEYISGFSGSAGLVVVTKDKAALWTDGRYFLAADQEMDCNWILMKQGITGVPTAVAWLQEQLAANDNVGVDGKHLNIDGWNGYHEPLTKAQITLKTVTNDLVDTIWTTGRPPAPATPLLILEQKFAGVTWQGKVAEVRKRMAEKKTEALVVTALDENAWLYNLRATDIPYNPFFMSYTLLENNKIRLYMRDHTNKLSNAELRSHLNTNQDGTCSGKTGDCVEVKAYNDVWNDLAAYDSDASINKVWISPKSSYAVSLIVAEAKRHVESGPIGLMKAIKNTVERQGMYNSQIRDSAALIEFLAMLERTVKQGKVWNETSAADELERIRRMQEYNQGLSFTTISAVGSNGAVIHYFPQPSTCKTITTTDMYLLDSGAQYLDGTTDVTRTFHYGTPTAFQKEAYTRVLMGSINLAMLVWPSGTYGRDIDVMARVPLWRAGLDYRHGTGHGIGAFLSVHEGPGRIALGYRRTAYESPLYEGMFFSDEPGYYEDGQFGVRLETIVMVDTINTTYRFGDKAYLGFKAMTLVPFEPHLINLDLLDAKQRQWLNAFHKRCKEETGKFLLDKGKQEAYDWLVRRTNPVPEDVSYTAASQRAALDLICLALALGTMLFMR